MFWTKKLLRRSLPECWVRGDATSHTGVNVMPSHTLHHKIFNAVHISGARSSFSDTKPGALCLKMLVILLIEEVDTNERGLSAQREAEGRSRTTDCQHTHSSLKRLRLIRSSVVTDHKLRIFCQTVASDALQTARRTRRQLL